jgi:uncharacterized membrane protein
VSSEINPIAATLARVLLIIMGAIVLMICAAMFISGATAPAWVWMIVVALGVLCFVSAFFNSAVGAVASVIILFFPIS